MDFKFTTTDKYQELHPNILKHFGTFSTNRIKAYVKLEQSVNTQDFVGVRDFCHDQLGIAGSYNCFKLEEITKYIQAQAHTENMQGIAECLPTLKAYLDTLAQGNS